MKKNSEYWAERAQKNNLKVIGMGEDAIDELKRILDTNLKDVQKEIKAFYDKYGNNPAEKLSYDEYQKYRAKILALAKKYPQDKTIQRLAKNLPPKYRIDRLRQLEGEMQVRLTEVTAYQQKTIKGTLAEVALISHRASAKLLKDSVGLILGSINSKQIKALLSQDWSGKNWSERLWTDREKLGAAVKKTLEKGVIQGTGYRVMARNLKTDVTTSFNNAFRLIRTESAFIQADVNKQTFEEAKNELGLEYYKYDAHLDSRTSQICRELHGKIFKIDDMTVGVNCPPMHPNCRSVPQLILDDEEIQEPVKELTEFNNFGKFNRKAYGLASYASNVKEGKKQAVNYARSFFDKKTLDSFYSIGSLSEQQKKRLGSQTENIKFSLDSFIKNRINHPEINFYDYKKLPDIIKNPDKVTLSKSKESSILFLKRDGKFYQAVIKTTQDKKENYLTSFRFLSEKEYNALNG